MIVFTTPAIMSVKRISTAYKRRQKDNLAGSVLRIYLTF